MSWAWLDTMWETAGWILALFIGSLWAHKLVTDARKKEPEDQPQPQVQEFLKPGLCECEHWRCVHVGGKGGCKAGYRPTEKYPAWTYCACQVYIPQKDDDEDNPPPGPTPVDNISIKELDNLYKK